MSERISPMNKRFLLVAALAIVAAACGTPSAATTTVEPGATTTTAPPSALPPAELNGTWRLISVALNTQMISVAEEFGANIELMDGAITGNGGCNSLAGSYTADAATISFGALSMTEIGCPGALELETTFVGLLTRADSYSIENGVLIIRAGTEELSFLRM
jgi:heat shock protein HslJ